MIVSLSTCVCVSSEVAGAARDAWLPSAPLLVSAHCAAGLPAAASVTRVTARLVDAGMRARDVLAPAEAAATCLSDFNSSPASPLFGGFVWTLTTTDDIDGNISLHNL
jgi:hypothetical protein